MPRVDEDLVVHYHKSAAHEGFLRRFNQHLHGFGLDLLEPPACPRLPPVFIIGPPRSGTTLVSQVLVMRGGYGYVSNFVARFYNAPAIGMMLQALLRQDIDNACNGRDTHSLESEFGRTHGLLQPHEFGYFWDRWFDRGQPSHKLNERELAQVPAGELKRELASMEAATGMPMLYKHPPYCSLQVRWLYEHLPNAIFISCMREPLYNAQSIANVRQKLLGSVDKWFSTKPQSIEQLLMLPWHEQIVRQLRLIRSELERARTVVPPSQWIECSYEELCLAPRDIVARVDTAVRLLGAKLPPARQLPYGLSNRNVQVLADPDFRVLRAACASIAHTGSA